MAFDMYDSKADPVPPPLESEWRRSKSLRRCECTDPWRLACENFDIESVTIRGNEACACRCHRATAADRKDGR